MPTTSLTTPLELGTLRLPNRLVMAPLTRMRADRDGVPGDIVAEHYSQRASMGLIVTEGTYPDVVGQGFPHQPGIATAEQVEGWRGVAGAVHDAGGRIFLQVMHAGRVSHPDMNGGAQPVAPSAVAIEGEVHTYRGRSELTVPHALTAEELPEIVEMFVRASRNAIEAGLDGVELHGANGYLLHEFLAPGANRRTDEYGGSPQNRARFVVELVRAVAEAVGAEKVGLRISPEHNIQDAWELENEDVVATYTALVAGVADLGLAYLSVLHREPEGELVQGLRRAFGGVFLVNSGFGTMTSREEGVRLLEDDVTDGVVVGRPAIANPDLARRWAEDLPENEPNPRTFYTRGATGYTDYPFVRA